MNKLQTTLSRDQRGVERQTRVVTLIVLSGESTDFVGLSPGVIPGTHKDPQDTRVLREGIFIKKNYTRTTLASRIQVGLQI